MFIAALWYSNGQLANAVQVTPLSPLILLFPSRRATHPEVFQLQFYVNALLSLEKL